MNLLPEDPRPLSPALSHKTEGGAILETPPPLPTQAAPVRAAGLADGDLRWVNDPDDPTQARAGQGVPPAELPPDGPSSRKPEPVSEKERVKTIDLLRGFALLGILMMNILSFAWDGGAYGSATHMYYALDSIAEVPKVDKKKEAELTYEQKKEKEKGPKPTYGQGEVRIAAVDSEADRWEYAFVTLLMNNKMRTLFSMLFGAGVLLMAEHSRGKKISPAWLHYRRMFWMLLMGAFHTYFVWEGDILFGYAAIGLVIYPLGWFGPKMLMAMGLFLFLFPLGIMSIVPTVNKYLQERGREVAKRVEYAREMKKAQVEELEKTYGISLKPDTPPEKTPETETGAKATERASESATKNEAKSAASPEKKSEVNKTEAEAKKTPAKAEESPGSASDKKEEQSASGDAAKTDAAKAEAKKDTDDYVPPFPDSMFLGSFESQERSRIEGPHPEFVTRTIREHRSRSYLDWFTDRALRQFQNHVAIFFLGILFLGWPMLIGMSLMKMGYFEGKWSTKSYGRWAVFLYLVGIPAEWYGLMLSHDPRTSSPAWHLRVIQPLDFFAMLTVTLANASLLLWLYKTGRLNWIAWRLEAVGRMALSNYLFHSVFFTLLFSSIGPGWFGALSRIQLAGLVLAMWAFQLLMSPVWLHFFRFGPIEWVWRSLTYWKFQPLLVRKAPVAVAAAA